MKDPVIIAVYAILLAVSAGLIVFMVVTRARDSAKERKRGAEITSMLSSWEALVRNERK